MPVVMGRVVIIVVAPAPLPGTVDGPREDAPPDWRERDIIIRRMINMTEERGWNDVMMNEGRIGYRILRECFG